MKVFVRTFGCRLNQAEGAQMEAAFEAAGFTHVNAGNLADVIVANTCTVTQNAEAEGLRLLRQSRKARPGAYIVLTGCAVATANLDEVRGIADLIIPHAQKDELVATVMRHLEREYTPLAGILPPRTQRAAIKVQDGCDYYCAYCIVPYARGTPQSRPFDTCLAEARAMIEAGFQEIVVTGCNTSSYEDSGRNVLDLVKALLALPGLGRLRLSSLEPKTFERDIAKLMADDPKLCRYLHLPIQSADNDVLRWMGRRYMIDHIRFALDGIYALLPDISIGIDLIAGLPGESEAGFNKSCALVAAYPFSNIHVFPFSERPRTAAAAMPNQLTDSTRKRRTKTLLELAEKKRSEYMQRFIGKPVTVLIEMFDHQQTAHGWSAEYLPCEISGAGNSPVRSLHTFTPTAIRNNALVND
ncbi:MAG: MiaB/RimO family radical SAM methylthiotransferase [Kiritimatiellaeota bacterium]|nr:MiaB/RimO family radical SAM methylthiotransferase [Kiritimatiellota bacterium]